MPHVDTDLILSCKSLSTSDYVIDESNPLVDISTLYADAKYNFYVNLDGSESWLNLDAIDGGIRCTIDSA